MKKEFSVLSTDKIHMLRGVVYEPEGEIQGFFQVVHGMQEHIGRYAPIMQAMCDAGFLCFGYDHLGHGKTARNKQEFGYIGKKGGHDLLCRDVKVFSDAVTAVYDKEGQLPYYLMGHSMGSFIVRLAAEKYVKPDKLIIMGTGGKNPAAGMGIALTAVIKTLFGGHHVSPLVLALAFGSYNRRFGGRKKADPSPWLTRDPVQRKLHYDDPLCDFYFSVSAMGDLIRLTRNSNRREWFENLPQTLPVLLVSGDMDPVGSYGTGVTQVCEGLKATGHTVRCILYPDARHEILNDDTYEQVKADILGFLAK